MSLQSRLFLFFTITVVVPLAIAGYLALHAVSNALQGKDKDKVSLAAPAAEALYNDRVTGLQDPASAIGSDPAFKAALLAGDQASVSETLATDYHLHSNSLDFAVALSSTGQILASQTRTPSYLNGVSPPTLQDLTAPPVAGPTGKALLFSAVWVPIVTGTDQSQAPVGTLVAGVYLSNEFAQKLQGETGPDVSFVVNGHAIASSINQAAGAGSWALNVQTVSNTPVRSRAGGQAAYVVVSMLSKQTPVTTAAIVLSTPLNSLEDNKTLIPAIVAVLALSIIGAALLAFAVAGAMARPLRELAGAAKSITGGKYDTQIPVRSRDEVGQLSGAFNEMSSTLAAHVAELQESREELKRSLMRFGETLRSTHDLDKILQVVLETSVDTVRADSGMLLVLPEDPALGALKVAAVRGIDADAVSVRSGEGIAGRVAVTGETIRLPNGDHPDPAEGEPPFDTGVWVPVYAQGRIYAVLCMFNKEDGSDFSPRDQDTVLSLADQAGVAIDNVVLHQEAQRLAITDSKIGIWNHRYFQLRFEQELDRSARFRRPFCLVLCDIDDFKLVNDTLGHLVGDNVLVELARRVRSEIRDIDVLARYGGEEFVLILPETDADGGLRVAEKIRKRIAETPFSRELGLDITISLGVSCFPRAGTDEASLVHAADVALYEAKARGKNCTVVYEAPDEGRAVTAVG